MNAVSVLALLSALCLSLGAPVPSAVIDLGGSWALANGAGNVSTSGSVPGQVHTDLMAAGIIQDPYFGFRDMEYLWIPYDDWTYSRSFKLGDLPAGSTVLLVAEGIDTAATIQINGEVVASTNNMFRRYVTDITAAVTGAENTISVSIQSAVTYSADQAKQYPYVVPWSNGIPPYLSTNLGSRNFIRKEQCQFGWDWGPAFMTLGIWKPIYLVVYQSAYLKDVVSRTYRDSAGAFTLVVDVYLEGPSSPSGYVGVSSGSLSIELSGNGLSPISNDTSVSVVPGENKFTLTLSPQDVQLWWPNGYGSPVLYNLTVSFADSEGQDAWTRAVNVGFRTVQLVTDPVETEPGKHFYFKVNDVPIFIKGANWIPSDAFESRVNSSTLWNLMSSALAANMNTLRVWGGGIYQHDAFYELADQHGLLVWQEFLFACAMYPRDGPFLENVKQEIRDTIRRLSNHPSIFLWSGNNENEGALYWYQESLENLMLYTVDYYTLTVETEMPTVQQEDDSRPFWPSSPSNGFVSTNPLVGAWGNVQDPTQGDVHFYNYQMNCYDVSNYPRSRFASEYGFQSYPSLYTLSSVLTSADYSFNSTAMLHRQHHDNGTLQLIDEVTQHFHWAAGGSQQETFENAIYLTQAMQALCIKAETEYYRSLRSEAGAYTMGTLYWQLNDIWPAPTWASIEYGGRWKMLHYYAAKFYASFIVPVYERPIGVLNVYATSDLMESASGGATVTVLSWATGEPVASYTVSYSVPALSSQRVYSANITSVIPSQFNRSEVFIQVSGTLGSLSASNVYFPSPLKNVTLLPPAISAYNFTAIDATSASVTVKSGAVAPFVFLSTSLPGTFSDNGFLLLPDSPVTLTFSGWSAFDVSQLAQSLQVKSLFDSYAANHAEASAVM